MSIEKESKREIGESSKENEGGRSVLMSVRCAEVAVFVL